jgi:cell division protein FtsN
MRLDYNEKKRPEHFERKPLQKNRPRKQPAGLFVLLSLVVLLFTFGAGVVTGWLLKKEPKAPAVAAQPSKKEEAALPAAKPGSPAPDTPLTFYKTLPAGGKGVIGSGLNLKKADPPVSATRPVQAAPEAAAPEEKQESAAFVVQIASYREQQDADKAQAKLNAKGIAAYVVESKLPDNSVWYRIRVGKRLSKAEAQELAGKAGRGAVVVAE